MTDVERRLRDALEAVAASTDVEERVPGVRAARRSRLTPVIAFVAFAAVIVALALFFGGFNFLEAGLPARLSNEADEAVRGASLGVFSTAQFLGIFAGGLFGGRFLAAGPPFVFLLCAALAAAWLVLAALNPERCRKALP